MLWKYSPSSGDKGGTPKARGASQEALVKTQGEKLCVPESSLARVVEDEERYLGDGFDRTRWLI